MTQTTIADSTCLIGLERIHQLELLPQLFSSIIVPAAVQSETGISADWLSVQIIKSPNVANALKTQLDEGEAEAIALALEINPDLIILDDLIARRVAQQLNLPVIGTVGVILKAKQAGLIDAVKPIFDRLLSVDFRVSQALIDKALELADEM